MGYLGVCPKQNPPPRPLLPPPPPRRKLRRRPASRSPAEEGAVWEGLKGWAFCSSVPETFSLSHFWHLVMACMERIMLMNHGPKNCVVVVGLKKNEIEPPAYNFTIRSPLTFELTTSSAQQPLGFGFHNLGVNGAVGGNVGSKNAKCKTPPKEKGSHPGGGRTSRSHPSRQSTTPPPAPIPKKPFFFPASHHMNMLLHRFGGVYPAQPLSDLHWRHEEKNVFLQLHLPCSESRGKERCGNRWWVGIGKKPNLPTRCFIINNTTALGAAVGFFFHPALGAHRTWIPGLIIVGLQVGVTITSSFSPVAQSCLASWRSRNRNQKKKSIRPNPFLLSVYCAAPPSIPRSGGHLRVHQTGRRRARPSVV